jgi:hypothetical protein
MINEDRDLSQEVRQILNVDKNKDMNQYKK